MFNLKSLSKNLIFTFIFICILSLIIGFAWQLKFIQDDAFISFRYARNVAEGHGLVWNYGEYVEGYTSFLWVLIMTLPHLFGWSAELFSYVFGMVVFTFTLGIFSKITQQLEFTRSQTLLALTVLGTNYIFLSYATSGMETMLATALILALFFLILKTHDQEKPLWFYVSFSSIGSLALLTRLDTSVVMAPLFILEVAPSLLERIRKKQWKSPIYFLIPWSIILFWLIWKVSYYGSILPNTFQIKVASLTSTQQGLIYAGLFLFSHFVLVIAYQTGAFLFKKITVKPISVLLLTMIATYTVYAIYVGGDFMDFRFFIPIFPLFVLLFLNQSTQNTALFCISTFLIIANQISVRFILDPTTRLLYYNDIDSVVALEAYLKADDYQWVNIGKQIGLATQYDPTIKIAAGPIGAIGYYSKATIIDMHGLTDRWVAVNGTLHSTRPGHQRIAQLNYLKARETNVILGFPLVLEENAITDSLALHNDSIWFIPVEELQTFPTDTQIIIIPLQNNKNLYALYLMPHPKIDALIQNNTWQTLPLETILKEI